MKVRITKAEGSVGFWANEHVGRVFEVIAEVTHPIFGASWLVDVSHLSSKHGAQQATLPKDRSEVVE